MIEKIAESRQVPSARGLCRRASPSNCAPSLRMAARERALRESAWSFTRPNPWPKTFGHHEFFHACTLLAALCHQVALYFALFR